MQRKSGTQESRKRSEFDQTIPGLLDSKFVSYHCETSLGVDKFGNEGASRLFTKIGERTLLDDSAFIHEHDFVSEISGFGKIEIVLVNEGRIVQQGSAFIHEHDFVSEISGFGKIVRHQKPLISETKSCSISSPR